MAQGFFLIFLSGLATLTEVLKCINVRVFVYTFLSHIVMTVDKWGKVVTCSAQAVHWVCLAGSPPKCRPSLVAFEL